MGDPESNLARAVDGLGGISGVLSVHASPVYRTQPQLVRDQPWFANQVARVVCAPERLSPLELLDELLRLEIALGRDRTTGPDAPQRFGPRVIDMDLLLYGDETLEGERLTLPHPRMRERAFVLLPLADIAPDLVFPDGVPLAQTVAALDFKREGETIWQE